MNVALQKPWTAEQFLAWAASREERYEFDGTRPVGMTGGIVNHNRIMTNLHAALRARLRGTPCSFFGPNLGVQAGDSIRYPDALITCAKLAGNDRLAVDVRVIFEVLSPSTAYNDRFIKVREYALIPTMRRYVLVESRFSALMVMERSAAEDPWTVRVLTGDEVLRIPEAQIEIPVGQIYEDVEFSVE